MEGRAIKKKNLDKCNKILENKFKISIIKVFKDKQPTTNKERKMEIKKEAH